jgi:SPP1 family predicted phage head-tail adaptor
MAHRITFLRREETTDELGQNKQGLVETKTVWADIAPTKGGEYYEAQKLREEVTWNVFVRYLPDITADMVIRHRDRLFQIKSVVDYDFKQRMLKIQCIEYVENGGGNDGGDSNRERD